ncbi:hypothetical protein SBOR_3051 [Sclerotinia borealis F-4128]|uniref:NmrA-like domain-containing protein n=1 Tax=Sclerotinia borealis (strain F-4128) TaxID=1432307 RepID=W9CPJ8_SCLBF|nr:hypothetical protein SBOR_3051 [Sclerotinia borealis F-4128]
MPYPGSTRVPCSDSEDSGMAVGEILRGGKKFFGKQIVLLGDTITEDERVEICANELGIKVRFDQVSPEQHAKRLSSYGLPADIVVARTELIEALKYEEELMKSENYVQTEEYIPRDYKSTTWSEYVKKEIWSPLLGARIKHLIQIPLIDIKLTTVLAYTYNPASTSTIPTTKIHILTQRRDGDDEDEYEMGFKINMGILNEYEEGYIEGSRVLVKSKE